MREKKEREKRKFPDDRFSRTAVDRVRTRA